MNRFCLVKNRILLIFALVVALCAFLSVGFASCSNLGDDNKSSDNIFVAPVVQPKIGEGVVCGTVESPKNDERTAMPNFPTITSYKITASNGSETKETTATGSGSSYAFALALPYGTWEITVSAMNGNDVILSQTKEITLNANEPAVNATFALSYNNKTGSGNVNLTIECPASIAKVEYTLGTINQVKSFVGPATTLGIIHNNIAAGSYNLSVSFYSASGELLFRIDQIVNVYSGLTTNKFIDNAGAPYKIEADGKIKIEQSHIDKFALSTIFVGGTGASDSNTGTQFDPVATLARAVALVNAYPLSIPDGGFNIFVQHNVNANGDIALNTGKTLSIKSATSGTTYTITGAQNTFTANANLTITDLKFDKMRFAAENGNLTMTNCSITGNTTTDNGGAIYIAVGRTCRITGSTINGNTAKYGGAIYISDGATVTISGSVIGNKDATAASATYVDGKGNCATQSGGGIYLNSSTSFAMLTIEGNSNISGNYAETSGGGIGVNNEAGNKKIQITNSKVNYNYAKGNGGGLNIYAQKGSETYPNAYIKETQVIGNKAGGKGGGIAINSNSYFGIIDCSQISSNNAVGLGNGIHCNGSLRLYGSTSINSGNDVYLAKGEVITICDALTATGTVASIILDSSSPTQYTAGTQVLKGDGITITDTLCKKFKLLNPDGTENNVFVIQPKTGDTTQGVLVKPTVPSGITVTIAGSSYSIKPTVNSVAIASNSTVTAGSTINFSVTDVGGNAVTGTSVIQLKDMGGGEIVTGTNSLTVPVYLGSTGGVTPCQLYMGLTLNSGVVVDTTININIE